MTRTRVVFLHRQGLVSAGSKLMRCDQLRDMAERYLGDRYDFSVQSQRPLRGAKGLKAAQDSLRDAIVIMLKGTPKLFGDEGMSALRKTTRALCIDYVDTNMEWKYSRFADVHISPSIAGMAILRGLLAAQGSEVPDAIVAHLTHHADPRLQGFGPLQADTLKAVYLGNPKNTLIPASQADRVTVLKYPSDREIAVAFDNLKQFNLHYAVRPEGQSSRRNLSTTKPFTKGFVAAAVGANVVASQDSDDALNYLGADYPFLVRDGSEAAIAGALDKAQAIFGTPTWARALDRMAYVRSVTSPASVARELDIILSRFA